MSSEYKRHLAFLLLIAAVVLAAGLGLRDPWPADEPRFALIARDMVESGNWLFPQVGGVLYPDKPPLFFWCVAALYALSGSIRVSILMPGILAGLGVLLLVTDLGRRLWNPKTGILCGATLLATLQFPLQMKMGQIDGLLCLWTTLGLYGFSRHLLLGPDWRWYGIGGLAVGLGVITKGVGFLPYLIFIPYLFATRNDWSVLHHSWRDRRWFIAPALTFLAISLWLVPMLIATGNSGDPALLAYRDNILFHQTVTRYADSWGHIKPPWYLFTNAASWLWMPITMLLPWLVPAWNHDLKNRDGRTLLLIGWIVLVLIFFSMSAGKRSLYIFPAAPALALAAGCHAERLLQRVGVQRLLGLFVVLVAGSIVVAAFYASMNPHSVEKWLVDATTILKTSAALFVTGIAMLTIVIFTRIRHAPVGFAGAMAMFWLGLSLLVAPSLNGVRSGIALMHAVSDETTASEELGFVAWPEQFLLNWDRPTVHFGYRRNPNEQLGDAKIWLAGSPDRRILLPEDLAASCFEPSLVTPVGRAHRRSWVIANAAALTVECSTYSGKAAPIVVSYSPGANRMSERKSQEIDDIDRRMFTFSSSN